MLSLSAKTKGALAELVTSYQQYLATYPELALSNICFSANIGRSHFKHRLSVVAPSTLEMGQKLASYVDEPSSSGISTGQISGTTQPKLALMFSGQGSQYVGMGRQLYETQPTFRASLERCEEILRPYLDVSLLEILYSNSDNSRLDQTAYTQPALFALEYALYQLWQSWGIEADVVMGHSVGEYVAATVAGVFSLEEGLTLIAHRGRLMQQLPSGGMMLAVMASEAQIEPLIPPYQDKVAIAAVNGPQSVVISGAAAAIETLRDKLEAAGIKTKQLQVSHGFHSPLMEPMLAEFAALANRVTYQQPRIPLLSNVTGIREDERLTRASYWVNHVRQPVQFARSMETLHQEGYQVFLEIGPKPILLSMGQQCLPKEEALWLPSLRPGRDDWQQMLHSLGELYVRGVKVDWSGFDADYFRSKVVLPNYPFQRQRYWVEESKNRHQTAGTLSSQKVQTPIINLLQQGDSQKLARHLETVGQLSEDEVKLLPKLLELLVEQHQQQLTTASIEDWLYQLEWQSKPRIPKTSLKRTQASEPGIWLILADPDGLGQNLADLLRARGHSCILIYAGHGYQAKETGSWILNPASPDDFERLLQEDWATSEMLLRGVIHLWSLEAAPPDVLTASSLEWAQSLCCASLLHLVRVLVKHKCSTSPQLWLVTRGALPVSQSLPAVAQAPLWGLGKAIALEHSEFWGGMVDLAPEMTDDEAAKLLEEIEDSQGEDHLSFRDGRRYVARLVRSQPSEVQTLSLRSDSTYLITGGLGALGLKIARWMVERGARHLVLIGRREASLQARQVITNLEQVGAKVLVARGDVTNRGELIKVLEEIQASMAPIKGIVHAAGILDDGILLQQNWSRFKLVMASKVEGTWNLHILTQQLPLDFFIMFSSAAALLGSPGQGNYAAANSFMDTLAHYRRSLGLPGLSINWGPWDDAGMAASLASSHQNRMISRGLNAIAPEQGLQVLEHLLGQTNAQVGVLSVDWSMFERQFPTDIRLPLLSELVDETQSLKQEEQSLAKRAELLQCLEEATTRKEREAILITYIQDWLVCQVAKELGFKPEDIDIRAPFDSYGMDSLLAISISSAGRQFLGIEMSPLLLLHYPTIELLSQHLAEEFEASESEIIEI